MHYPLAFSFAPNKPVMVATPPPGKVIDCKIGQRIGLSNGDILAVRNILYPNLS